MGLTNTIITCKHKPHVGNPADKTYYGRSCYETKKSTCCAAREGLGRKKRRFTKSVVTASNTEICNSSGAFNRHKG